MRIAMHDVTEVASYFKVETPSHAKYLTNTELFMKEGLDSLQVFRSKILSEEQ